MVRLGQPPSAEVPPAPFVCSLGADPAIGRVNPQPPAGDDVPYIHSHTDPRLASWLRVSRRHTFVRHGGGPTPTHFESSVACRFVIATGRARAGWAGLCLPPSQIAEDGPTCSSSDRNSRASAFYGLFVIDVIDSGDRQIALRSRLQSKGRQMRINRVAVLGGVFLIGMGSVLMAFPAGSAGAKKALAAPMFVGSTSVNAAQGRPLNHTFKVRANPPATLSVTSSLPPGVQVQINDTAGTASVVDPTPLGGSYSFTLEGN